MPNKTRSLIAMFWFFLRVVTNHHAINVANRLEPKIEAATCQTLSEVTAETTNSAGEKSKIRKQSKTSNPQFKAVKRKALSDTVEAFQAIKESNAILPRKPTITEKWENIIKKLSIYYYFSDYKLEHCKNLLSKF